MRSRLKRLTLPLILGLGVLVPAIALADDDEDQDRARQLFEDGDIRGLSEVLEEVGERMPGDVVAVDLVKKNEEWIYQIQVIDPTGRRQTLLIRANAVNDSEHEEND